VAERNGQQGEKKRRVLVMGNCVADRLQFLLPEYPGFGGQFRIVPAPMIHTLTTPEQWQTLAAEASTCDVIFSQPLFNFGPCNTEELRKNLSPDQRLILFSSPDFEAYFPDAIVLRNKSNLRFKPSLDWDSSIIFSCFAHGVSIFDVEAVYLNHPLFHAKSMREKIARSLENYAQREQNLDISTLPFVLRNYSGAKLFHSPRHPVDSILSMLLRDMASALGLPPEAPAPEVDGFGFNQWPVITRHHDRFSFPDQPYFVLAGKQCSLEDVAMAYYNFYEFHPHVVEANKDKVIAI
jgi:hypothetical protein